MNALTPAGSKVLLHLGRDGQPLMEGLAGPVSPADPFAARRQVLFDDGRGHRAGLVRPAASTSVAALGHAEMVAVMAGELRIAGQAFGAGSAFVLPLGFSGPVEASADALAAFVSQTSEGVAPAETALIALDPALPRNPSAGPAAAVLVGPAPKTHSLNLFTHPTGFRAGVWDVSTPCERTFVPHRIHELMMFLEGEVTLTHQSEGPATYRAGDVVFVPQGAPYAWINTVKVVKFYTVSG